MIDMHDIEAIVAINDTPIRSPKTHVLVLLKSIPMVGRLHSSDFALSVYIKDLTVAPLSGRRCTLSFSPLKGKGSSTSEDKHNLLIS